ncbi:unnamed protein product, partial [marine sediment metagenome]
MLFSNNVTEPYSWSQVVINIPCIAAERLQFYKYALLGGLISVAFAVLMIPQWGLFGAAFAILIAQLLTNNWIIPWISLNLLQYSFRHYFLNVILRVLGVGIIILLIG